MFASQSSQVRHTTHPPQGPASTGRSAGVAAVWPINQAISPFPRLFLWHRLLPGFAGWLAATESRSVRPI